MDSNFNPRQNFVTLKIKEVIEARENNILIDIDYRVSKSNRVKNTAVNKWGYDANVYMGIPNKNMMIMHVRDSACVIIPKTVVTVSGEKINVADRFKKYYFGIDKNDNVVCQYQEKKYKLYRMLFALVMYGDETIKISEEMEVHHKWMRYLNTMECMTLLGKEEHKAVHKITSQESHRMGREIMGLNDLVVFIREQINYVEFWKNREY